MSRPNTMFMRESDELPLSEGPEVPLPPEPAPAVPPGVILDIAAIRRRVDDAQMALRQVTDAVADEDLARIEHALDAAGIICTHARIKVTDARVLLRNSSPAQKE